jgi:hypothetical protein
MLAAAVVEEDKPLVVEQVAQVVVVLAEMGLLELLELLILVVAVVAAVKQHLHLPHKMVVTAAPVLSSSRPINNEDKWKPKSIGCMESTPQCTCFVRVQSGKSQTPIFPVGKTPDRARLGKRFRTQWKRLKRLRIPSTRFGCQSRLRN